MLLNYLTGLYYGIILRDCITGLYYEIIFGIMLRTYIMGSYKGIILWDDIIELYYKIIFMKSTPGMPGTAPEPPPLGCRRSLGHAPLLGPPGTPLGPLGTSLRAPGHAPETPQGRPWEPWRPPGSPLMADKNGNSSTNIQRQKLSIAVFEPAQEGPSHERLDLAVCSIRMPPKYKKLPAPGFR